MLDQSFSAENFRKIFDYENRKGNYLEDDFFPEVKEFTKQIKEVSVAIRQHRKTKPNISIKVHEEKKVELYKKKVGLKEEKEKLLLKELEKISSSITEKNFSLGLREISAGKTKGIYGYKKNAASYFALKQIQSNLCKLYKVKQANRHNIVCQLREAFSDKLPKHIIKTDISSFYESIPRDRLLKKLNDDPLLTFTSKKIVCRILHEYEQISGKTSGLPRGVGISAYLSELYLRKFDEIILKCPQVLYYARYVDDIIIVCSADPGITVHRKLRFVKKSLSDIGLTLNKGKTDTKSINAGEEGKEGKEESLDYLGYNFTFGKGSVGIKLTESKIQKYENKIKLSFKDYHKTLKSNKNKSKSTLLKRVRFLTGNTRLVNNKKNAVVGIYFSCCLMNDTSCLDKLDEFLNKEISSIKDEKLKRILSELSFKKGFDEKRFFKFSANDFKRIVKVWKHKVWKHAA